MVPSYTDSFLEPLARLLSDVSVSTVFINGPGDVRVERQGRTEATHVLLTAEEVEEMAAQVIRRSGMHPQQLQASCRLEGGLRMDLVRAAAVPGGAVLVLSRERSRPRDIDELFGPGSGGLTAHEILRCLLDERRGVLVVGRSEMSRSGFLMALVEDLPPQERVLLIDRGIYNAPRYPHLVRLLVDVAAGATRSKLLQAAQALRGQRLVLDEIAGDELCDLLLGEGDAFSGVVAGVAGDTVEAALARLRAVALVALGRGGGEVDPLLASRFGAAVLIGEATRRKPAVLQLVGLRLSGPAPGSLVPHPLYLRSSATEELKPAPTAESATVRAEEPPGAAPRPSNPQRGPRPSSPSLPPSPPAASDRGSASLPSLPCLDSASPLVPLPEPDVTRWSASPSPDRAAAAPPQPAIPRPAPAERAEPAAPLRTVAVPRDDIFDEMFASLPGLPAMVATARSAATGPGPAGSGAEEVAAEEIDDSLLYRDPFPATDASRPAPRRSPAPGGKAPGTA